MDFWKSMAGMVELELTSADPERLLREANEIKITIYHMSQRDSVTCRFYLAYHQLKELEGLCAKRGGKLEIIRFRGLYFRITALKKRPVILAGLAFLLCLMLFLPTRVLFVQVEGNSAVPANQILEAAERSGIRFGASRREVRSERVKNALLGAVPELQWAGVNTKGCVAVISVRERADEEKIPVTGQGIGHITACRDGIVSSCTVVRGTALCTPGQAVKEGQILISGYTDCGICILSTQAEGEVYGQTIRQLQVITPEKITLRGEMKEKKRNYSLLIGKKRINLWKGSRIWDTSCGRMYEEYYVTLPGGFCLPLGIAVETEAYFETRQGSVSIDDVEAHLSAFAGKYLKEQMIAGAVLEKKEQAAARDGLFWLEGRYICSEMIGRVQQEKIGEYHGENG